jgi:hypothetical protein
VKLKLKLGLLIDIGIKFMQLIICKTVLGPSAGYTTVTGQKHPQASGPFNGNNLKWQNARRVCKSSGFD